MARDLGKLGIRVNTVAPGIIDTPMGASVNKKVLEGLEKATPLGRRGKPEEIAMCIVSTC